MESPVQANRWAKPLLTGFTVPAILAGDLATGKGMVVGLDLTGVTLLALTVVLSALTFAVPRTTVLEGLLHLAILLVYVALILSP